MKRRLLVVLFVIIAIALFIAIRNRIVKNKSIEQQIDEMVETGIDYIQFEDFNELGLKVAEKNGNWSKYNLSKNFLNKYNEKDGIFGNVQFDKVEYKPYNNGKYSFEDYSYLVLTQGLKKTAYIFSMVNGSDGYDIIFGDTIEITDENGQELDAKVTINNDNFTRIFHMLSRGGDDERSVAVTPNFYKKYPFFLDIFEHYSPLRFNPIEFVPDRSSWDKQEAYFIVDSKLECKKRYYKVKFTLDDKGYLDDVKVNKVNEEEYKNAEWDGGIHIFYINSNWEGLNLTDSFKIKFQSEKGVFPEIDKLGYNFSFESASDYQQITIDGNANVNQIRGFRIDDKMVYYLYQVFKDENGNIDNVEYKKLSNSNLSIEEAKELYLKEYNK